MPKQQRADEMRIFIPLTKVDVEKRIIYGTLAAEAPDKSGEILDYDSAKEAIQKWSDEQAEASDGKSLGNVREMHSNIAAGKLTDLVFDDMNKSVEGACKVVDDGTWSKVLEGVLTGFSIGGGYAKRWTDPANPMLKRYSPKVTEFSIVDSPCLPGALFEVVKADGSVELRKFHASPNSGAKEAQPSMTTTTIAEGAATTTTTTATLEVPPPKQGWQATDGSFHAKKHDALAKNAELLVTGVSKKADEALQKLDDGVTAKEGGEPAKATEGEPAAAPADAVTDPAAAPASPATDAPPAGEAAPALPAGGEAAPVVDATATAEKAAPAGELKKGLYDVSRLADSIMCLSWLCEDTAWESRIEGDASTVPGQIKAALATLCAALKAMVNEEADELLATTAEVILVEVEKGAPVGALAKFIKADADGLAKKAGAVEFVARLEKAIAPAAAPAASLEIPGLTDEQLTKLAAFDGLRKKFDEQADTVDKLTKRLEKVEATPAETKGVMNTALVKKNGHEGTAPVASPVEAELQRMIHGGASPEQTAAALMKMALQQPVAVS